MKSVVSSRSALIIAAGLFACLYGPLQPSPAAAAPQDGATQASPAPVAKKKVVRSHAKHVKKKTTPAKPKPSAENTKEDSKPDTAAANTATASPPETEASSVEPPVPASSALPASIANANAQFPQVAAADGATPSPAAPGAAGAEPASAQAGGALPVVAPDEVNELDRAAEATPPTTMASTTTPQPAPATVGTAQVSSATANEGAWDKASLIGKIFIAAGGLLTLASAARMFMA